MAMSETAARWLAATVVCVQAGSAAVAWGAEAVSVTAAAAWRELLARPDPPAAKEHLDAVLAACGRDVGALRRLIASDAAYAPIEAGWHSRSVQIRGADGKREDVRFAIRVPRSYRPDRAHAVLVAAHGQHGSGRQMAAMIARLLGGEAERYILVAPTLPGPRHYSGKAYQERAYLEPLRWVRRRLNVDDDRICITGYSQGGHCTWHLATLYARHFAAAVAMAGVPWFEGAPHTANMYLENLEHLPLWAIWGEKDAPAPPAIGQVHFCRSATRRLEELGNGLYRGTELPGVGHGGCWPNGRKLAAFLAAGRRKAAPLRVTHFFHLEHHKRGYWLEANRLAARPMRMDRPIRVRFSRRPSETDGEKAMDRYFRRYLFKMWGEVDRETNTLTVRTSRVTSVRIYLIDGLLDLSRPVTLKFGRRSWRGEVPASARCMLHHYADTRDATALVVNEIDLPVTARALIRYKP